MKQKEKKNPVLVILVLSLCANLLLAGAVVGCVQKAQNKPLLQNGTYLENTEELATTKVFALCDAQENSGEREFYYYTESPQKVIEQGKCKVSENGVGILKNKNSAVCGYVIPIMKDGVELVWLSGEEIEMSYHNKAAILP